MFRFIDLTDPDGGYRRFALYNGKEDFFLVLNHRTTWTSIQDLVAAYQKEFPEMSGRKSDQLLRVFTELVPEGW